MKFLVMIYNDASLLDAVPTAEADAMMRHCFENADAMRADGKLFDSQQLEAPNTAKTVRVRNGKSTVVDGPFAETKEFLAGFNLIEAENMDEALKIAQGFPWAGLGSIEVRPVRDMEQVRQRVGA